jgi:acyl carrier protein
MHDRIGDVFARHLHIPPPAAEIDLFENGVIDSLTFVELISKLEQEFSIRISLETLDLNLFRSIVQIGEFIQSQLQKPGVAVGPHPKV